jgi:hypothetical protein
MKEVLLALMIGLTICYETYVLFKTRGFVRALYILPKDSEEKLAIRLTSGCFSLIYLVWLFLGMALSGVWYAYLVIFILSVLGIEVTKYFKKNEQWESLIVFKKIDCVISISILVWLFFAHFHPEVLGCWKINL